MVEVFEDSSLEYFLVGGIGSVGVGLEDNSGLVEGLVDSKKSILALEDILRCFDFAKVFDFRRRHFLFLLD